MKTQPFEVGDIVQLKSGSPRMTVTAMQEGGNAVCVWFAGATLTTGTFPALILSHAGLMGTVKDVQSDWREWIAPHIPTQPKRPPNSERRGD